MTGKREPAGRVKILSSAGWRVQSYVMGCSVALAEGEWLDMIWADRPVMIMQFGLPVWLMPQPGWADFGPGQIAGGRLNFRRMS